MKQKKKQTILTAALILCAAVSGCRMEQSKDSDIVMEIAGKPVVKAEYQMILEKYDAQVKGRYTTEEANRKDFWVMEADGGRPVEQLMELAREDLIYKKVVAKLAEDLQIPVETDYTVIAGQLEENEERKQTGAADEKEEYGISSHTLEDLYSYVYTDVETKLIESLKKTYRVTDEELRLFYQENIQQYTSEISVRMLVGEAQAGLGEERQVYRDMNEDVSAKQLSAKYPAVSFYELEMSSLNKEEGKSGVYLPRWEIASYMQEGSVCEPFFVGQHWMVMRCLKREEQKAEPYEKMKGMLENEARTKLAREEIEKSVKEAAADVKEERLEQAALEVLEK